jgi:hypothetical protein
LNILIIFSWGFMRGYIRKACCESERVPLILLFFTLEHLYLIQLKAMGFVTMRHLSKAIVKVKWMYF